MTTITREDGQRFVIPSYRDVLSAKKLGVLEKQIRLLASSYGDYINLQKKNIDEYEVAFSSEHGYLLGETVWSYFKKPKDLIYCEEIPNTNDAVLVIVKSGSVYLDGSFSLESISDELIIFLTQTNHFDIYIYGNVPISQIPEEGKFSFDASSVASFNVLDKPVFPRLSTVPMFELQLVDKALQKHDIGVFPFKKVIIALVVIACIWAGWDYMSMEEKIIPVSFVLTNPYADYMNELTSPAPWLELDNIERTVMLLFTIPGWAADKLKYQQQVLTTSVKSLGMRSHTLLEWAKSRRIDVLIKPDGYYLSFPLYALNRTAPNKIYKIQDVISTLTDRVSYVLPGNSLAITSLQAKEKYSRAIITIKFNEIVPGTLTVLAHQLKDLPLILNDVSMDIKDTGLSGTITVTALGN